MNAWLLLASVLLPLLAGIALLHWALGAKRLKLRQRPADFGLPAETLRIPIDGKRQLFAWWIAAGDTAPTVILLHGWGSSAAQLLPLAVPFHRAGFHVLLFDARNHGRSARHGISSMPAFADDLARVRRWLRKHRPAQAKTTFLVGHSVGAAAVLLEAARHPGCQAVISLAAFAHPERLMRRHLGRYPLPRWLVDLILRYIQWIIGHRFDDIAPVNTIRQVECPILIVHGSADDTVPVSDATTLIDACPDNRCQLMLVDDATHESIDAIEAHGAALVEFLQSTLPRTGSGPPPPRPMLDP